MELTGWVKNYDWGRRGINSAVAQLAMANDPDFRLDEEETYAEMWMGTHVCGVSVVKETGETLDRVLKQDLSYLFKVLSINKALSIQVHPNKCEAERLHKERPEIYRDPNHKPELAIALTPFLALVGFMPAKDIRDYIDEFQPLSKLIGKEAVDQLHDAPNGESIKLCYEKLMKTEEAAIAKCINDIAKDYQKELKSNDLLEVFTNVNRDFPGDVGVLSLFFLNLIRLKPGQAIYLGANEIHAYLDGDCVECMACSDNVIRAGLTPKYKDVDQLLNSVIFESNRKEFIPYRVDEQVQVYIPPVSDFAVINVNIDHTLESYKLEIQAFGSILIVLKGSRTLKLKTKEGVKEIVVTRGSIVYIPAEAAPEIEFAQAEDCDEDFSGYIATSNYFRAA
ncbi:mannose-6-phosphate isomerase [Drosophila gunungcola]|uniref:mannose-6-phosphate isomerase n=1 Tax=Drosophila gunungcola TaxID=103775 RepID=UPI0022DE9F92|nr:mannose-6-phosphate isomerase [Drosophila gunungcola]XP_052834934.1 mannose-6-phosphate isomerase [Drosophila gunungcola]XP_052834935.1 mannose-6-phosphate isomerase [Drosophila gunungcola]